MSNPIPDHCLTHAVILFDQQQDSITPFVRHFDQRFPDYDPTTQNWTTQSEPRACVFGPLAAAGWQYHLTFDPQGMTDDMAVRLSACRQSAAAQKAVADHHSCALLFLERAPAGTHPWKRMQSFADQARVFFDLGASVILFPPGLRAWHHSEFAGLTSEQLEPEHFGWFADWRLAGKPRDGLEWVRTHGLNQFDLPELAWTVPAGSDPDHGEGALGAELFDCVPPYLIDRNEPFAIGDWINLENATWDVVGWADRATQPELSSELGTQIVSLRRQ